MHKRKEQFITNVGEFIFTFGRNPELSYLELLSLLKTIDLSFRFNSVLSHSVVLDIEHFNPKLLIPRLAGTTKISKVKSSSPFESLDIAIANYQFDFGNKRKWRFSIDLHSDTFQDEPALRACRSWIKGIIKRVASEKGIKAEYEELSLSALFKSTSKPLEQAKHSHFVIHIDKKKEKVFISDEHEFSNPMEYKEKTDNRPFKDFSITSSFRIARMLVNISGVKSGEIILDPFCGLGTILSEGLFIGCNVIGVEINPERVKQANKNCVWYKNRYIPKSKSEFKIIEGDSTKITQVLQQDKIGKVDYIISEPELGPLLRGNPTDAEAKASLKVLEPLYTDFFKEAYEILKEKGKIIIILPEFKTESGKSYGLLIPTLEKFKIVNPTNGYEKEVKIPIECSEEWNYLNRMLYILEKK